MWTPLLLEIRPAAWMLPWLLVGMGLSAGASGKEASGQRQIEAVYASQVHECRSRFVVTSCVEKAKAQRRRALDELKQRQTIEQEGHRKQRAIERQERLREKQQEAVARRNALGEPPEVVQRETSAARKKGSAARPDAPSPGPGDRSQLVPQPDAALRSRNESAYWNKQQAAQTHREAVERRNAQRAAGHKPAAPLPLPAGASSGTPARRAYPAPLP
jgi:colicin import membrane protein